MNFNNNDAAVLKNIILHRRDVRGNNFLPTAISEEITDRLLFAFEHAPSVGYSQPWQVILIRNNETKQAVKEIFEKENIDAVTQFPDEKAAAYTTLKLEGIMEAPVNMAVFYTPPESAVLGQTSMKEVGLYSVVCGIQNLWLMARALNIGVGWVSILHEEKVKQLLQVPRYFKLIAYLCIGYVNEFYEKPELEITGWANRKNRDHFIHQETFNRKKHAST